MAITGSGQIGPNRLRVCDADEPDPQDIACDVLIVATKACQVADVLKRLIRNAGSADEAHAALPADVPVFSSIMMTGIERRSPTYVNVNVQASPIRVGTLFGAAPGGTKDAVARGQAGFLPITYDGEIEPAILNKFLFNTCLNAIGATYIEETLTPFVLLASLIRARES